MWKDYFAKTMMRFFSRKFLLTACWFVLLFVCIIKDGDMIQSGFAMVIAVTGAIVNGVYILGAYLKEIKSVRYKDFEIQLEKDKNHVDGK